MTKLQAFFLCFAFLFFWSLVLQCAPGCVHSSGEQSAALRAGTHLVNQGSGLECPASEIHIGGGRNGRYLVTACRRRILVTCHWTSGYWNCQAEE